MASGRSFTRIVRVGGAAAILVATAACDLGAPPARYAVPGRLAGVGDVDGDGILDLVTSGDSTSFGVLVGDGSGGFGPVNPIPHITQCGPGAPDLVCTNVAVSQVVDLNLDGLVDVVVSYHLAVPGWYEADVTELRLADGSGGFSAPIDVAGVGTVADVTGDGHLDRVETTDPFAGPLSLVVRPGDGVGHFGPAVTSDLSSLGLRVPGLDLHDLDGDGDADVVLDGVCIGGEGESYLRGCADVMLSDGSGTFTAAVTRLVADDIHVDDLAADLVDVDGDGDADIVAGATGVDMDGPGAVGAVYSYLGDGTGGFGPEMVSAAAQQATRVMPGEFDGDGYADLLTIVDDGNSDTTDYARVLFGDGTGRFPERNVVGAWSFGMVDDLDLDGRSDFLVSTTDEVTVYLNRWDGRPG